MEGKKKNYSSQKPFSKDKLGDQFLLISFHLGNDSGKHKGSITPGWMQFSRQHPPWEDALKCCSCGRSHMPSASRQMGAQKIPEAVTLQPPNTLSSHFNDGLTVVIPYH